MDVVLGGEAAEDGVRKTRQTDGYVLDLLETFKFASIKGGALIVRCPGDILDPKESTTVEMPTRD